ncbi:MAG: hypothetical protein ACI9QR_002211, partial [Flavobacteriaceae bacterium]
SYVQNEINTIQSKIVFALVDFPDSCSETIILLKPSL